MKSRSTPVCKLSQTLIFTRRLLHIHGGWQSKTTKHSCYIPSPKTTHMRNRKGVSLSPKSHLFPTTPFYKRSYIKTRTSDHSSNPCPLCSISPVRESIHYIEFSIIWNIPFRKDFSSPRHIKPPPKQRPSKTRWRKHRTHEKEAKLQAFDLQVVWLVVCVVCGKVESRT